MVASFNLIESLGSGYTMRNIEDEYQINLIYLNYCIMFLNERRERDAMKAKGMSEVYYQQ